MPGYRFAYFLLFTNLLAVCLIVPACSKNEEDKEIEPTPPAFSVLPEDSTGSRTRSITYVYDRTAVDGSYPPKIDSSIILFSYNTAGKIDSVRWIHNDSFLIYDFSFEWNANNKLAAIRCKTWSASPYIEVSQTDLDLEYTPAGTVSLMKSRIKNDPYNEVDSFIIKSTGTRIDTVIDRTFASGSNADKYAFTYNGAGDITQMDRIRTSGIFFVYEQIYRYTLSGSPAALVFGDEAIFWYFFAQHVDIGSNTDFMVPPLLFHSSKQPSRLVLQVSGIYTGTYNYQTQYYQTGLPKKMTANVITGTGAFYAREAYYYTYAR